MFAVREYDRLVVDGKANCTGVLFQKCLFHGVSNKVQNVINYSKKAYYFHYMEIGLYRSKLDYIDKNQQGERVGNQIQIRILIIKLRFATMTILPEHVISGLVLSIVGLTFVAPFAFLLRKSFRGLEYMQIAYLYALNMAFSSNTFSNNLGVSIVKFDNQTFFPDACSTSGYDVLCSLGFQISFTIVLVGFLLLLLVIVSLQKCRRPTLKFEPVYCFLKGFFKWTYVPIAYYSCQILIAQILSSSMNLASLITSAGLLGFILLFPIFEFIGYKCLQEEADNIWRKYIDFFGYARIAIISVLLAVGNYFANPFYFHFIWIALVPYTFITAWKGEFFFKVGERVLFLVEESAFIVLFALFKYDNTDLETYDLDFFLLGLVLFLEVLYFFVRVYRLANFGKQLEYGLGEAAQINPVVELADQPSKANTVRKINKFEVDSGDQLKNSRESGMNNGSLVKNKSPGVKRK